MDLAKKTLKEARRAIEESRFDHAILLCRNVLSDDRDNFNALLLLSAALRDDAEAASTFERALALNPDSAVVIKGFVNFCKRNPTKADPARLLRLHLDLYRLGGVAPDELLRELQDCATRTGDSSVYDTTLYGLWRNETVPERKFTFATALAAALNSDRVTAFEREPLSLKGIVSELDGALFNDRFLLRYIKCLSVVQSPRQTIDDALRLLSPCDSRSLKRWLCEFYIENCILEGAFDSRRPEMELLLVDPVILPPDSQEAVLRDALTQLLSRKPLVAYFTVTDALKNAKSRTPTAIILCARCCIELYRWSEAEAITKPLTEHSDPRYATCALRIRALCLCNRSDQVRCSEGIRLFSSLKDVILRPAEYVTMFNAAVTLELYEAARKYLDALSGSMYHPSLSAVLSEKIGRLDEAMAVLENNRDDPMCLVLLGIFYITQLNDYKSAFTPLLMSAKQDPYNYILFLHLGNAYMKHEKNFEKAKKCFQKCLELNPECTEAATSLSSLCADLEDWQRNFTLLSSVISSASYRDRSEIQWAWLRLGLHFIALEQWDDAVVNLRTYMRLNPSDPEAWSVLADAYHHRGSYMSALKCYLKAIELDPSRRHCRIQVGTIQCLLRQYDAALESFDIGDNDYKIPSLRGLADVKLCLANDFFTRCLYGACRDSAQAAIDTACDAIPMQNELTSFWKILYGSILTVTKLPKKYNWIYIDTNILSYRRGDKIKIIDSALYDMAIECIQKTINLRNESKFDLFNDLAHTYYKYYEFSGNRLYAERAYEVTEKCLEAEKFRWQHWNLMGLICSTDAVSKFDIAQHSFIKALEIDPVNSVLWSNLGVFYSKMGHQKYANQSFMKAQESNPTYINSWIGQASIAEVVQESEAIDLYRHASQLGYNDISSSKYGYWIADSVCMKNGDLMHRRNVPTACDAMSVNHNFHDSSSWNLNVFGILLEKMGRHGSAVQVFRTALDYVDKANRDPVLSNLGRAHFQNGNFEMAIEAFTQIIRFDLNSSLLLALSYYNNCEYKEAYSTYEKALSLLADTEREKINILTSMACVLYECNEMDSAKLLLYQCIDLDHKTTCHGLISLCVIALTNSDYALSRLIVKQLKRFVPRMLSPYVITVLEAYSTHKHFGSKAAISYVSGKIRKCPNDPSLWQILCGVSHRNAEVAKISSKKSIMFGDAVKFRSLFKLESVSELLTGNVDRSKIAIQKAIIMDPMNRENRSILRSILQKCR